MPRTTARSGAWRRRLATACATGGAVAALVVFGALAPAGAAAHEPGGASAPHVPHAHPAWEELSGAHQKILAPLQPLWNTFPEINRRKWQRIADRYPTLKPEEQARLQERMAEWVKMTPQQRRVARENYQITRTLPPEKKADAWDRYQQLPDEQKKKLAAAEKVPRRPGAVSGLPSAKRLPAHTSKAPASAAAALAASPASAPLAPAAPASAVAAAPASPVLTEGSASAPAAQPSAESLAPPVTGEAATQ